MAFLGVAWLGFYSYFISLHLGKSLPLILYAGHFVMWGFFFTLGIYFKRNGLPKISFNILIPLMLFALFATVLESNYIMNGTQSMRGCGQKISVFALNTIFLVLIFHDRIIKISKKIENTFLFKFFLLLGEYSFGLYLIHLYILKRVFSCFAWIGIPSLKWVIGTIIASTLLCFVLFVCKKISPKYTRLLLGV